MNAVIARCERWVWYVFLATAAWQTRIILWQADTVFIEWRSAALYWSDALMLVLFACALLGRREHPARDSRSLWAVLCLLLISAVLSLAHALQLTVGIVQIIRLAQYIVFFLYLRHYAWHRFDADRSALAFVIGALSQAALGISQFLLQHDVGLRWTGETILHTDMRGVAVFYDLVGTKILRAYGALPHPNILAAYLLCALWLVVWLWMRHGRSSRGGTLLWQSALGILLLGQYLTFSRTILAVWGISWLVLGVMLWTPRLRAVVATTILVTIGFVAIWWPLVVARMTITASDEAVQQRIRYNRDALLIGAGGPLHINWIGVGIGNFTTWLAHTDPTLPSYAVQPAHNVYLMVYSELGVIGVTLWLVLLAMILRILWTRYHDQPFLRAGLSALIVAMLLIGALDHFYWTLQQGRILWWAALALAAGRA